VTAARRAFRDVPEAHVATVDRSSGPHVVPLWFVWLEDALYLTCRAGSAVAANLERGGDTAVAISRGLSWNEHQGVLVRGRATLLPAGHSSAKRALSAWFQKYAAYLSGSSFARYTEEVEHPIVVKVLAQRVSLWGSPVGR